MDDNGRLAIPARLRKLNRQYDFNDDLLTMDEVEKNHIARILAKTGYNLKTASKILKISRTTLWRRMRKYRLSEMKTS